jgi:hypothetical protein
LAKLIAAPASSANQVTQISAEQAAQAVLGAISGAAVITDANGTVQQYLRGLVALYLAGLKAGEAHIGQVGGHSFLVTGSLTRPADTPGVYHSKDEINVNTNPANAILIEFANMARVNGGGGIITCALKRTNNVAANSQIRLHLYNSEPTGPCGDHTQFTKTWANKAKEVGVIDFSVPQIEGTGSDMVEIQSPAINISYKCLSATAGKEKSLFGRAEVLIAGAGAPTASQIYEFVLSGYQD